MKKDKIESEEVSINFRISQDLKKEIVRQAKDQNITVSKYLRSLLEEIHDGSYCDAMDDRNERDRFVYSTEFIALIIWIYSIHRNQIRQERDTDAQLDIYIKTLKRADAFVPSKLNSELDKVLIDLYRIKKVSSSENKCYEFINIYGGKDTFDYKVLDDFFINYADAIPGVRLDFT